MRYLLIALLLVAQCWPQEVVFIKRRVASGGGGGGDINWTELTQGSSTSNNASTASIAPTANAQVFLGVCLSLTTGGPDDALSVSGASLTWTNLGQRIYGSRRACWIYRGTAASPTSGAITINYTGFGTFQELMWSIDEAVNVDSGTPTGATFNTTGSGTSMSVTISETPDAGDHVYGIFAQTGAAASPAINGELSDTLSTINGGGNIRSIVVGYDSAPDGTPTPGITWSGSEDYGGLALIVNKAP